MKLDFTDVKSSSFEPLPAGWYHVIVNSVKESEAGDNAKNPGAPMLNMEYVVQSGDYEDRHVFENVTIVQTTLWKLKGILEAMNYDVSGELEFDPDDFVGNELQVKLSIQPETKDFDAKNNVKGYKPLEDSDLP